MAHIGRALSAPGTISLENSGQAAATVALAVRCSVGERMCAHIITANLSAIDTGWSSVVSPEPHPLGVAGRKGTPSDRGNWPATAPTCSGPDSAVYFDGSAGPLMGPVLPGMDSNNGVTPVSFRLCTRPGNSLGCATITGPTLGSACGNCGNAGSDGGFT